MLSLDGGVTFIDGYDRAQDRSCFSPAHLNHEDSDKEGCNCVRVLDKEGKGVAFFTQRLVAEGEELCFDYGYNADVAPMWAKRDRVMRSSDDKLKVPT